MSEGRVLGGDPLPQPPAAAGAGLCIAHRRMVLVSVNGSLSTASVGDKHQIFFRQWNLRLLPVNQALDGAGSFFLTIDLKADIGHLSTKPDFHARLFQILLHRQDQGLILVVTGKF